MISDIIVCEEALERYGIEAQQKMLVEECGELLSALGKLPRGRATVQDLITELADVHIMITQMALYYGWDEFQHEKERKLKKLKNNLKQ